MTAETLLNLTAAIFCLAAVFGYLNHRLFRLPLTISLVAMALASSMCILLADSIFAFGWAEQAREWLRQIDFHDSLMLGMLSFLLFAGALHVDLSALKRETLPVLLMATLGLTLSTIVVGLLSYFFLGVLGVDTPLIWCMVFGALISPTDPVAVLSILKQVAVPSSLKATIAGESLFNDGFGVVLFLALLGVAQASGADGHGAAEAAAHAAEAGHGHAASFGFFDIASLFGLEVGVGALLGVAGGWIAVALLRGVDDYVVEIIVTLALVLGVYAIAVSLHASGPLAVVLAGLIVGDQGARYAMSETTREHLETFWELIDEILNAALFLLIGFEILLIEFSGATLAAALLAVPAALIARSCAVATPLAVLRATGRHIIPGATPVLIWGGLRGGISVALALSLPQFEGREVILAMTYAVVVFSIIGQGLTVERVVSMAVSKKAA